MNKKILKEGFTIETSQVAKCFNTALTRWKGHLAYVDLRRRQDAAPEYSNLFIFL